MVWSVGAELFDRLRPWWEVARDERLWENLSNGSSQALKKIAHCSCQYFDAVVDAEH